MSTRKECITGKSVCQEVSNKIAPNHSKSHQICIIEEEMKRILQGTDGPAPEGLVCENFDCPHNIFWKEITKHQSYSPHDWTYNQTPMTRELRNCMVLLNGDDQFSEAAIARENGEIVPGSGLQNDKVCGLEDIAMAYGVSCETIRKIEAKALKRMKEAIGGQDIC